MKNFWLTFAIAEALAVAGAFVNISTLTPAQKAALDNFIAAGAAVDAAFSTSANSLTAAQKLLVQKLLASVFAPETPGAA